MLSTIIAASFATAANADTRVAQATATWQATAIKDTTSMLVVTPLKSLTFNYAEGQKSFNQQMVHLILLFKANLAQPILNYHQN